MTSAEQRRASIDSNRGTGMRPGSSPLRPTRSPQTAARRTTFENVLLGLRVADDEGANRGWRIMLLQVHEGLKGTSWFRASFPKRRGARDPDAAAANSARLSERMRECWRMSSACRLNPKRVNGTQQGIDHEFNQPAAMILGQALSEQRDIRGKFSAVTVRRRSRGDFSRGPEPRFYQF